MHLLMQLAFDASSPRWLSPCKAVIGLAQYEQHNLWLEQRKHCPSFLQRGFGPAACVRFGAAGKGSGGSGARTENMSSCCLRGGTTTYFMC